MKTKPALLALVLALSLSLCGCGEKEYPKDPPDLYGEWTQTPNDSYYHIATIDQTGIRIYWYVPSDGTRQPYWIGTFTPPTDGKEPYQWESKNDMELSERFVRASREETKVFTYQDGEISYGMIVGRFKSGVRLKRVEDVAAEQESGQAQDAP